jgi:hypothetical protein
MLFLGIGIAFGASGDMTGMQGMNGASNNTTNQSITTDNNNTSMMTGMCMMKKGNCMMPNRMSGNSSPEMKNMGMNGQGMMKEGGMMSCC